MSLIRERRCRPEDRMSWRYSACFSFTSPNIRSASTSEKPRIAFSGVRSSWDMLARNSDLWRLAASSCRLLSAISRKSRAFWMARADWVAKVWRSSMTSGANAPGVFLLTVNAADQLVFAQHRDGEQRPVPGAEEDVAEGPSIGVLRRRCRGSGPARAVSAMRPMMPSPLRSRRAPGERHHLARQGCGWRGAGRLSVASSYSKTEQASVPASWLARVTIGLEHRVSDRGSS